MEAEAVPALDAGGVRVQLAGWLVDFTPEGRGTYWYPELSYR